MEQETLRYLGYGNAKPDERILSVIRDVAAELEVRLKPKSAFGIYDCQADSRVTIGGMVIESGHLARHMRGCRKAAVFAVTLGTEADLLIRRYSVQDMERAAVLQAACAARTEALCDSLEKEIAQAPELRALFPITRFSPGYGDFGVTYQKDVLTLLDTPRKIALTLTDAFMLTPTKSVTAIQGFRLMDSAAQRSCLACDKTGCQYRRTNQ